MPADWNSPGRLPSGGDAGAASTTASQGAIPSYDFFAMTLGPRRLREQVLAPVACHEPEPAVPL